MKKFLKIVGIIIAILVVLWVTVFAINFVRCSNLQRPILMEEEYIRAVEPRIDDNGNEYNLKFVFYYGMGYTMHCKINSNTNQFEQMKMYFGDELIKEIDNRRGNLSRGEDASF